MLRQILLYIGIWFIACVILFLIITLPTDAIFETGGGGKFINAKYDYKVQSHIENVKVLAEFVRENKGLGEDHYERPVALHILEMFGRSLKVIVPAIILSLFAGLAKGVFDFRLKRTKFKAIGQSTTWGFLSIPDLIVIIGIQLFIIRSNTWISNLSLFGHDKIEHVIFNILFLSIYPTVYIANITFHALQNEEGLDYIRTARSKGTSQLIIMYKHMLKNGMNLIFSHSNTMILYLLSNIFIMEVFMDYKGAAYYLYKSLANPSAFFVGHVSSGNTIQIIGYAFLFTLLILVANIITIIAKSLTVPGKRGESL